MKILPNNIAILENDTHISYWVEQSGRLDHDQNLLPRVLKYIHQGDVVIDAGAFIGDHTLAYSRAVGHKGRVHAFEPNKDAFECLKYNLGYYPNVTLYDCGLSCKGESFSVERENDNYGMAYLKEGEGVKTITIDSLALERLDFIKIDVEGMELDILEGAFDTIRRLQPRLLIEINRATLERACSSPQEIYQYLEFMGYSYRNIYAEQGLNDSQFDILCEA